MSYYNNALIKAEAIAKATDYLTDEEAKTVMALFPEWQIGVLYETIGERLQYNSKLYKVKQAHTSQAD